MQRGLFLDRDGVINVDHGYVFRKQDFEFIDGIFEICQEATRHGYLIFIVTNQAGIARGYYTEEQFHELMRWVVGEFLKRNIKISQVYFCPFHPTHGKGHYKKESHFRKPAPGMLLLAADEFMVDLNASILVGDKISDMQAGIAAGVGRNLLYSPSREEDLFPHNSITRIAMLHTVARYFASPTAQLQ
jgi:D-glycero-D-manno-heptose 1,7-bisphosphate phosphatase